MPQTFLQLIAPNALLSHNQNKKWGGKVWSHNWNVGAPRNREPGNRDSDFQSWDEIGFVHN